MLNIVKMPIFPNLIYRFNKIPVKIMVNYFFRYGQVDSKVYMERQDPEEQT